MRKRAESIFRDMSNTAYEKLRVSVEWDVRYLEKTYDEVADRHCLTRNEVSTLLNKPRKRREDK